MEMKQSIIRTEAKDRLYVLVVSHTNGWFTSVKSRLLKCKHFPKIVITSDIPKTYSATDGSLKFH